MDMVMLPPRIRTWDRDGWRLYFDPHNFKWVRVNDSGHFILGRLRLYRSIEDIIQEISERFELSMDSAHTAAHQFIENLSSIGFLHKNAYNEGERPSFGPRKFAHTVYMHLTNNCNLKCPYCYNKSDREYKIKMEKQGRIASILTTEESKALIFDLVENGVQHIVFTGGEPLMRPDALELFKYARSLSEKLKIEVLTNGILIKESVAEKLCDYVDMVTISLDGHEQHLHERYRGRNTFAPTVRGIRTLVEVRNKNGQKRPNISLVPALTNKNIGFMKEIYEFALDDLGVDGLAPILFQAGDHQQLSTQQIPTLAEWGDAQIRTRDYLRGRPSHSARKSPPAPVTPRNHCGVGEGEFSIDPAGFVYPCQTMHFDQFICGNIRDANIKDIYDTSPVMRQVRTTAVDNLDVCRHCDVKYFCNGGCRSTAYNVYGVFDKHNELYCRHLEKLAVDRMWANCELPLHATEGVCA
ncbi:PqqD family peptide modification chaperone [Xanthomonas campestris]|uniref:PqqD family peptide modification chaperone n=1 Tax=Xanthomonas campestris TaxID=339 RepID=UPI001E2C6184|nr:PqqD family peptide modification chaperone [Xanthomonas campestris]MCC4602288.1 PqqD family peptide modification chaperone [Xanthomonas campestris pv. parthenii]